MAEALQLLAKRKKFGRGILRPFLNEDGIVKEASLLSLPAVDPVFDGRLMKARFTISTPGEDRSEDIVPPGVIDLKNYTANPVVMYDHGLGSIDRPIGKSFDDEAERLAMAVGKNGYEADCYFSESYPEAVQIAGMVEEGVLKAASIHISNIQAEQRSRGSGNRPGLLIKSAELLEWSIVGIPDNPEAVRKLLSRGTLAGEPICDAIKDMLKAHAPAKPAIGKGFKFEYVAPTEVLKMADEEPIDQQSAEEPIGAQIVVAAHSALKSLVDQFSAALRINENAAVNTGMDDVQKMLSDAITALEGLYKSAYPDGQSLSGEDEADPDEETIAKGVRAFLLAGQANRHLVNGLVKGVENLAAARNLSARQKADATRFAGVLSRITKAAESEIAKSLSSEADAEAKAAAQYRADILKQLSGVQEQYRTLLNTIEDARPSRATV